MSRKEINRYYPPDQDPTKVKFSQKQKKTKNVQSVRLMIPFSMKCLNCNEYISQSRKFNARKEVTKNNYLGIPIIKFEVRCPRCAFELIFETDPKNGSYQCIKGCKKNYEKPEQVKSHETVDEMIVRLDKEFKENEKMKQRENDKSGKHLDKKIDKLSEDTAMEQLEKRLEEQQREQERIEELEDLQEHVGDLERKRLLLEEKEPNSNDNKEDDLLLVKEAQNAFKKHITGIKRGGLINNYSDSDSDNDEIEEKKRSTSTTTIKGIVKRRKIKVIR